MAKKQQAKPGIGVLIALLATVIIVVAALTLLNKQDESAVSTPVGETSVDTPDLTNTPNNETITENDRENDEVAATVDPATLSSLDVEPLGVTIFYTKGTPGFDFQVKRAGDGTQYAEFSATSLVGTKCTDDTGLFASIIKNPGLSGGQTTISQSVKVGDDTFGLSLSGKGCTGDVSLLEQYQSGFTNGFSNLQSL